MVYARDDRPWVGPDPPAAVYFYSPDRKAERPTAHLEGFRGVLQVDGYAGFERLTTCGDALAEAIRYALARWATVCSLIATARLNDVDSFAYLKDALERMSSGLFRSESN